MSRYTYTIPALFMFLVFVADLLVPKDIEVHVLYLAVVALATKTHRSSLMMTVLCCGCVFLGGYLNNDLSPYSTINRSLTVGALITTSWLAEQIISALQTSKEDQLTQIYNRRGIDAELRTREVAPTAAILVDLDDFKRVNDTWGLLSGDLVLKEVADMLTTVARSTDVVGRWGGDEFIILLWDTKWNDAPKVVERFYRILSNARVEVNADGAYTRISASLGVVQLTDYSALGEMVKTAQEALKTSKHAGKNTITYIDSTGTVYHDDTIDTTTAFRKKIAMG